MKIKILVVGKPVNPHYASLVEEYLARIRHYLAIELEAVRSEKIERLSAEEIKNREADRLLQKLAAQDLCLVLDRNGSPYDSEHLAKKMNTWLQGGRKRLTFIIGGPLGLGEPLLERADEKISLSSLTLAHELALVVLLEQLYRAFSILRGEKYHK